MRNITPEDRENAKRLKSIWNRKKAELALTQVKAAKTLGMTQASVAQYLNCHIALNTDKILAFAKLLRVEPWEIDPSLGSLRTVPIGSEQHSSVAVIATLSGSGTPLTERADVRYSYMVGQCYGLEVDSDLYAPFAKRGAVVVASRAEEPVSGDDVVLHMIDGVRVLAEFHRIDGSEAIITRHSSGEPEGLPMAQVRSLDPIVEIVRPNAARPRRLHIANSH